ADPSVGVVAGEDNRDVLAAATDGFEISKYEGERTITRKGDDRTVVCEGSTDTSRNRVAKRTHGVVGNVSAASLFQGKKRRGENCADARFGRDDCVVRKNGIECLGQLDGGNYAFRHGYVRIEDRIEGSALHRVEIEGLAAF